MNAWILILWMSCDAKGMTHVNLQSKKQCIDVGEQFIDGKTGWLDCLQL